jgi:hypothetical protein
MTIIKDIALTQMNTKLNNLKKCYFFTLNYSKVEVMIGFKNNPIEYEILYKEYIISGYNFYSEHIKNKKMKENLNSLVKTLNVLEKNYSLIMLGIFLIIAHNFDEEPSKCNSTFERKHLLGIELCKNDTVDTNEIMEKLISIARRVDTEFGNFSPMPFICKSGAFGYNTFLILACNGIAPIGVATTSEPYFHNGVIHGRFLSMTHDLDHCRSRYAQISIQCMYEYAKIYKHLVYSFDDLSAENKITHKKNIFFLFFLINEIGWTGDDRYWKNNLLGQIRCHFASGPYREPITEMYDLFPVLKSFEFNHGKDITRDDQEKMPQFVRTCMKELFTNYTNFVNTNNFIL